MTEVPQRALVIEDDPSWQQILSEILIDTGLEIDAAGSLAEALALIKRNAHLLAVVDLSLEGENHHNMDGLRVLEALKRSDPSCRSILLTGFATVELAVSALTEYGAYTFLRKENFSRFEFRGLLRKVLSNVPAPVELKPGAAVDLNFVSESDADLPSEKRVLVAEDDAGWRSILSELLSDSGYSVRVCAGYGDALGCIRRESFDLAIFDLSLSDAGAKKASLEEPLAFAQLEGYQLLEEVKRRGIPAIVVSGIATTEEIHQAYMDFPIFAYLEKQTFDRGIFRSLVKEAIAVHSHPGELSLLTGREREVFDLMAKGLTNKEIADILVISSNTVKRHLKSIFDKLEVHTRSAAISKAVNISN
jgi:DNA-binding NarL/FixJ family response regulator